MKIRLHILAALAVAPLSFQVFADCVAVETAPAPAQAAAPIAAAPVAAAPASTPVATPAPVAVSASTAAVILRAVALRDRPMSNSTGDVVVPADKRIRLERNVSNADGNWWYVTADGLGGGWVPESELGNQQK